MSRDDNLSWPPSRDQVCAFKKEAADQPESAQIDDESVRAPGMHLATSPPEHVREPGYSKLRFLQAQNQAAIDQLRAGTDANRAKFLDQRLHKQQKLAAGAKYSRQWYANEKDWLAGTTADAQAAPAFFDEHEHVSLSYTNDVQPDTVN